MTHYPPVLQEMLMKHAAALIALSLAFTAAPTVAQETKDKPAEAAKITDKNHPDYVKCRTESVIGSRAKKRKVCMTNAQWAEVARNGNERANKLVESGRAGMDGGQ